ncbi:MAG: hypothetical protein V8Q30_05195 [Acutalibacteraceae bacterium]
MGELIQTDEVKQYILERMGVRQIFRPPFEEFRDLTPEEFVRKVLAERFQARVVACGENFHFGKNAAGNAELLCQLGQEYGIEVIVVPLERENGEVISSTLIARLCGMARSKLPTVCWGIPIRSLRRWCMAGDWAGSGTIPPPTSISRMSRSFPRTGSMPP